MRSRGTIAAAAVGLGLVLLAAFLLLREDGAGPGPLPSPDAPLPTAPDAALPPPPEPPSLTPAPEPAPGEEGEQPPSEPKEWAVLVVRVEAHPSGDPIPGAEVELREEDGGPFRTAATGPDGSVRLEDLGRETVDLLARAPGRATEFSRVSELDRPGERSITVPLGRGVDLAGVVRSAGSRRPIPGATVRGERGGSVGNTTSSWWGPPVDGTRADEEGRFRVRGLPLEVIVTVAAEAPGFVPGRRSLLLGEGAEEHPEVELLLEEAARATGVVTDPEGRPVPDATVSAIPAGQGEGTDPERDPEARLGPWGGGLTPDGTAKTDFSGRYRIDGLRVGVPYRFVARGGPLSGEGLSRSPLSDPPQAATAPGQELVRDLRLRREAVLRVRVADAEGKALEEAAVSIAVDRAGSLAPEKEEGASWRFPSLTPGEYRVVVAHRGLLTAEESATLAEGETRSLEVVLERGASLSGTVVDDRGIPLPGASVTASPRGGNRHRGHERATAKADDEGRFVLEGLRPGPHNLSGGAEGHAGGEIDSVEAPADGVRLVVARAGTVRIRLVAPPGTRPPSRFSVAVMRTGSGYGHEEEWNEGRLRLEGLSPDPIRIVLGFEGFAPVVRAVDLEPGEDRDLGEVLLDAGAELAGLVRDEEGGPVAGARAEVGLPGFMEAAVATSARDGRFRVPHLPLGETTVRVSAEGRLPFEETLSLGPGVTPRTFVVRVPGRIRVVVTDGAGKPVPHASIRFRLAGDPPPGVPGEVVINAGEDGRLEEDLLPGAWEVAVLAKEDDRVLVRATVTVAKDRTVEVPLTSE